MAVYCKNGHFFSASAPPPGKELKDYTMEIVLKSNILGITGGIHVHGVALFSCPYDYDQGDTRVIIILYTNGYIEVARNSNVGEGYKISYNAHLTDRKIHKIVFTRKNNEYFKFFLDGVLTPPSTYNYSSYTYETIIPNFDINIAKDRYFGDGYAPELEGNFYLYHFKLYDKALNKNDFFKKTAYSPLYSIPGIFKYIKKGSDLYLKDWSGNNNDFKLYKPTDCKSDVIISNLSFKE